MIDFIPTNEADDTKQETAENDPNRQAGVKLSDITLKVMKSLKDILPYLDKNLEVSNLIYAAGGIGGSAWELIRERHRGANIAVSSVDYEHGEVNDANMARFDDCEKRLCDSASWIIIDMRDVTMGDDLPAADKKIAIDKMKQLEALLKSAGYTEWNKIWNIPALPMKKR